MNKYTARALNEQAAVHGRIVMVVSGTTWHAADAFDELLAAAHPTSAHVSHAAGAQRIDYLSGGRIIVRAVTGHAYRGVNCDTVFIEADAEQRHPGLAQELIPCTAASPHGEVISA